MHEERLTVSPCMSRLSVRIDKRISGRVSGGVSGGRSGGHVESMWSGVKQCGAAWSGVEGNHF